MKTLQISAAILFAGATLLAIDPAPLPTSNGPRTPLQRLEEIKAKNNTLIQKQAETLKLLEQLDLQAQQLRIMGRRT